MQRPYSSPDSYPPEAETTRPKDTMSAQAKAKAKQVMENAKEQGRSLLAERKRAVADEIVGMAEALRKASQEMRQQEQPFLVTPYAERAADGLERFSETLRERNLSSLVRQVEDFARRQPGIFIGGSVAAGFMLARFLRSSAAHSEQDYVHPSVVSGGSQASYSPVSAGETTAASQRPDVIYAPPLSEAATLAPGQAPEIPTGQTKAVLFEESEAVGVGDEDNPGTGLDTPAAEDMARVVFEKPEVALAAEAIPPGVGDEDKPQAVPGTPAAGRTTSTQRKGEL